MSPRDSKRERREPAWAAAGYSRPIDYGSSGLWARMSHSWVAPMLERGKRDGLVLGDSLPLLSECDHVEALVRGYEKGYSHEREQAEAKLAAEKVPFRRNGFLRALLRANAHRMALHCVWTACELAFRVLSPFALRQLVRWLQRYDAGAPGTEEATGWLWACMVIVFGLGLVLSHHQLFWVGMRLGFQLKQQARAPCAHAPPRPADVHSRPSFHLPAPRARAFAVPHKSRRPARAQAIAAVQEKLLRLNGATLGHLSSGRIINLVSNDVRRFDDVGPFWVFVWAGPLETSVVLLMVALELGIVPAVAGVGTLLLLVPLQATLASTIAGLRTRTAGHTDERVRITGAPLPTCGPAGGYSHFSCRCALVVQPRR